MLALCSEHGYPRLTLPLLLDRAGVEEAEFHRHFADLEDCFCSILEAERDAFFAAIDVAVRGHDRWVDRLRAAAYALLRFLRADRQRAHFLTIEIQRAGERAMRIWSQTIVAPLFALIDEGRAERPGGPPLSRATTAAVGGAVFTRINAAAAAGTLLDKGEAAIPQLMYAAVLPYLGPEAAAEELRIPPPEVDGGG